MYVGDGVGGIEGIGIRLDYWWHWSTLMYVVGVQIIDNIGV